MRGTTNFRSAKDLDAAVELYEGPLQDVPTWALMRLVRARVARNAANVPKWPQDTLNDLNALIEKHDEFWPQGEWRKRQVREQYPQEQRA